MSAESAEKLLRFLQTWGANGNKHHLKPSPSFLVDVDAVTERQMRTKATSPPCKCAVSSLKTNETNPPNNLTETGDAKATSLSPGLSVEQRTHESQKCLFTLNIHTEY